MEEINISNTNCLRVLGTTKGQFLIETALLMMVTLSFLLFATKQLREFEIVKKLVGEPWTQVAGMIESGSWNSPATARQLHPNQITNGFTYDPAQ